MGPCELQLIPHPAELSSRGLDPDTNPLNTKPSGDAVAGRAIVQEQATGHADTEMKRASRNQVQTCSERRVTMVGLERRFKVKLWSFGSFLGLG